MKGTKVIVQYNICIYHHPFLYTSLTHRSFFPVMALESPHWKHDTLQQLSLSEVAESKGSEKAQTQNHSLIINTQGQIRREKQHSNLNKKYTI